MGEGRGWEGGREEEVWCLNQTAALLYTHCVLPPFLLVDPSAAHHVVLHQVVDGLSGSCRDEVGGVSEEDGAVGECAATRVQETYFDSTFRDGFAPAL